MYTYVTVDNNSIVVSDLRSVMCYEEIGIPTHAKAWRNRTQSPSR